ncbi:HD-GYP domain-containing protein [Paenibacillus turpanensis]|uniref:HD-GYP domain-containing protein n=1 Tax=Paenibacillus turpanensis TaxID=2689078 RepID=UPI00140A5188|nr:HD-GYP domain-containing protein [Paenibacillus turpanensis]
MRVNVTDLQVGDKLTSHVFNQYGLHVLSSDSVLSANDIAMLFRHGIEYVDIAIRVVDVKAKIAQFQKESQLREKMQPMLDQAVEGLKRLFEQAGAAGTFDPQLVDNAYQPLAEQIQKETDVVSLLLALEVTDDYTYQHSVQVGMISYFIAKWMGKSEAEAQKIGKAGFLHDIGKTKIPHEILYKKDKLTTAEFNEIKKHTTYGHDIIVESLEDASMALVALQHHERMNGRGYPNGDSDSQIHPYAKIVSVAEVYCTMISSTVYQAKRNMLAVLQELHNLSFTELDPQITHTFIQNMIPNFIGKKITLDNGQVGTIVMTNANDFFRPLIQIDNTFIDLSKEKQYAVKDIQM